MKPILVKSMMGKFFFLNLLILSLGLPYYAFKKELHTVRMLTEEQALLQLDNILIRLAGPVQSGDYFSLGQEIVNIKKGSIDGSSGDDHSNILVIRDIAVLDSDLIVAAHTDMERHPAGEAYKEGTNTGGFMGEALHENYGGKLFWHGRGNLARLSARGELVYKGEEAGSVLLELDTAYLPAYKDLLMAKYGAFSLLLVAAIWSRLLARRKWMKLLKRNEDKYRALLENLPQRIFLKDKNSSYISCSSNYAGDLGINPHDIAGKSDYDFFPKEVAEKYIEDDKRVRERGEVEDSVESYIQEGEERYIHLIRVPVKGEKGGNNLLGLLRDITDERKAEEKLEKIYKDLLKKSERLDRFNQVTVGWELEVMRLKEEVNDLLDRMGEPERYSSPEEIQNIH